VANAIYPLYKQALMRELSSDNTSLDLGDDQPVNGVYLSLVTIKGGYVYSDSHQFFSSISNTQGPPSRVTSPVVRPSPSR
jgi:hypothetical protein